MREVRLFVDTPLHPGAELPLPVAAAQHALRALRLRAGDPVTLFNGDGRQYASRLTAVASGGARARIDGVTAPERESPLRVTLLQALARGDKMDWVVQKATELGVHRIVPLASERSEVKLDAARSHKRLEHWRAIVIAACEQCGRNSLPRLDAPLALAAWLAQDAGSGPMARWMLHPGDAARLRDLPTSPAAVVLAVGPEGGFGDADLAALQQSGYRAITLGPRILRTETAGIAAIAALQALHGDF